MEKALFEGPAWLRQFDQYYKDGTIPVEMIVFEWLKFKTELVSILCWEEEGGAIIEIDHSMLD